jgi:hypothetical protein
MKKLITLIAVGSLLLSSGLSAQVNEPVRARDGTRDGQFGVPNRMRENQDIQECIARYEEVRGVLSEELKQLRERMATAAPEDQAAIKEQIREQLRIHCDEQRELRKELRGVMRKLREERIGKSLKKGT